MSTYATTADEFVVRIKPYQEEISIIISDALAKGIIFSDDAQILRQMFGLNNGVFLGKNQIRASLHYTDAQMDKRLLKIWNKLAVYPKIASLRSCLVNLLRSMPDCVRFAVKS